MKKIITLLTIITGVLTFSASAQSASDRASIDNTIGFGPRLGYYKAQDARDGNYYGGIQARARWGSILGVEGSLEYRAGNEFGISEYSLRTSFIPITTSLMIFIPMDRNFTPYGLGGVGAYYISYNYSDGAEDLGLSDDSSFNLGYHIGFGAEFPLNSNFALSLDYRYLFLNSDKDEASLDDTNFNANLFTAALMFYF